VQKQKRLQAYTSIIMLKIGVGLVFITSPQGTKSRSWVKSCIWEQTAW